MEKSLEKTSLIDLLKRLTELDNLLIKNEYETSKMLEEYETIRKEVLRRFPLLEGTDEFKPRILMKK